MNRERRKEVGRVFFDLSKYLLTTVAAGSLVTSNVSPVAFCIAMVLAGLLMLVAWSVMPPDKED